MTTVFPCPNCGHAELGDICPVCDCGDPTNMIGPHKFADRRVAPDQFADRRVAPDPTTLVKDDAPVEFDLTDAIIRYETDEMKPPELLVLFAYLVNTGMAWTLQGHYGRTARALIEGGYITDKGNITPKGKELS